MKQPAATAAPTRLSMTSTTSNKRVEPGVVARIRSPTRTGLAALAGWSLMVT